MELVGVCVYCGTEVYCRDGFLDGVSDNDKLTCHACYPKGKEPGAIHQTDQSSE